jgi:hypothetical protein
LRHHDKIQALLDKNPKASRQELAPQIYAISDETHRQIHPLLTDRQNWKRRCRNASMMVERTGDLLRLRQRRQSLSSSAS